MKIVLAIAVVLLGTGLPTFADEKGPVEPAYLYRAEVIRGVDDDTIDVDIDLGFYTWINNQRIRLVSVDAPEPRGG